MVVGDDVMMQVVRHAGPRTVESREYSTRTESGNYTRSGIVAWVFRVHEQTGTLPNEVMNDGQTGKFQFDGKTNVEKTSGVWVDGQYVGYLKELQGSKKVLLLPGEHTISVRQNGYQDSTQTVVVQPGQTHVVRVSMMKAATGAMPPDAELATIKVSANPSRAAVFLDGRFVGHVGELSGVGRGLQVVPGTHQIRIALPGYTTFQTDINPLPKQKVEVKTDARDPQQ